MENMEIFMEILANFTNLRLRNTLQLVIKLWYMSVIGLPGKENGKPPKTEKFFYAFLCEVLTELEDITFHPEVFDNVKVQTEFYAYVSRLVASIRSLNESWAAYRTFIRAFEDNIRDKDLVRDERKELVHGRSPWASWCRNRSNYSIAKEAVKHDTSKSGGDKRVVTAQVCLPRAALWLSEQLVDETNEVVEPLLQVRFGLFSRARWNLIKANDVQPGLNDVYYVETHVPGQWVDRFKKVNLGAAPDRKCGDRTVGFGDITDLAKLCAKMDERHDRAARHMYASVVWWRETNLSKLSMYEDPEVTKQRGHPATEFLRQRTVNFVLTFQTERKTPFLSTPFDISSSINIFVIDSYLIDTAITLKMAMQAVLPAALQSYLTTCSSEHAEQIIQALREAQGQHVKKHTPEAASTMKSAITSPATKTGKKQRAKKSKLHGAEGGPKRPLNSWMAFRKSDLQDPDGLVARGSIRSQVAYSVLRGSLEKDEAPLDEFFTLTAPLIGVVPPEQYQGLMGWVLVSPGAEADIPQVQRAFVPSFDSIAEQYTTSNISVNDLVEHCIAAGYPKVSNFQLPRTDTMDALTMAVQPVPVQSFATLAPSVSVNTTVDQDMVVSNDISTGNLLSPFSQQIETYLAEAVAEGLIEPAGQATLNNAALIISNADSYPYNIMFDPAGQFDISYDPSACNAALQDDGAWDAYNLASNMAIADNLTVDWTGFVQDQHTL
nr:mating-type protein mat-1 [Quercus suber]